MKLNEILTDFEIFKSNEEKMLLDKIRKPCYAESMTEREIVVAESLVRKSLLSKILYKGSVVFIPNEKT